MNNEYESKDDAIANILYNEFTCQINADILPFNWNNECNLDILAKGSAKRLSEPPRLYRRVIYLSQAAMPDRVKLS